MTLARRRFLGSTAAWATALVAAGWLSPRQARAAEWNKTAFEATTLEELLSALGVGTAIDSDAIRIDAPDVAENGAVVQIGVASAEPDTESIALLVEKNPTLLAAMFTIPKDTLPELQTRVKMAETCHVYALVKAGDRHLIAARKVEVILGGCG